MKNNPNRTKNGHLRNKGFRDLHGKQINKTKQIKKRRIKK